MEKTDAQLKVIEQASAEVTATLAEVIFAAKADDGTLDLLEVSASLIGTMLATCWKTSVFAAEGDRQAASRAYSHLLRNHLRTIEAVTH